MVEIREWHDKTLQEPASLRAAAAQQHYRFQPLSLYGTPTHQLFAAV